MAVFRTMITLVLAQNTLIVLSLARFLTMTCDSFFLWMVHNFTGNKESDTWFSIAKLIDFAPKIHHAKEMDLLTFVIGGLNTMIPSFF